jgi:hypothetical protein
MTDADRTDARRLDDLERRVAVLEVAQVTRERLDEELRSLEQRLRQLRESTEG